MPVLGVTQHYRDAAMAQLDSKACGANVRTDGRRLCVVKELSHRWERFDGTEREFLQGNDNLHSKKQEMGVNIAIIDVYKPIRPTKSPLRRPESLSLIHI